MIKKITLLLILIGPSLVFSQEQGEADSFKVSDEVRIDGAPKYYSNYFSEYYINKNWNFRIEMQEMTVSDLNGTYSVFDFPFLVKYKMTNKFSVLFGPKARLFKGIGGVEHLSLLSTFRVQYDVTESLSLEAGADFNITPSNSEDVNYNLDDGMVYKFGGRFKF